MTDEHGSDSQPVHDDVPVEEHPTHEAETGVWSDDHPPVDDFADTSAGSEETAAVSHEVAAEADETASSANAGSSRSMMPLFAGIGGVLLIGAVIYWQFGHSSPPPVVPMQISAPKSALQTSTQADSKPPAATAAAPTTAQETDIASLKPTAETPPAMPPNDTMPATTIPAALPPSIPASTTPASTTAPAMAPAMPAATPPQAIPAAVPASPAVETRIETINMRIDNLQKSLNDATRQLNQLSNMVAASQAMPPVSNQTNPALEDRLNKIEQNLMQVEHNEAKPPPVLASSETTETPATTVVKTTSHHTKSAAKHKNTHKKTKTHRSSPVSTVAKVTKNSSAWVLRAATPGEAWVSTDASSAELRHVQVGDSLAGVGDIRAIRQTASGWEIEGSSATVR